MIRKNETGTCFLNHVMSVVIISVSCLASSCHLDGMLVNAISNETHFEPPTAPPTYLTGQISVGEPFGVPGAQVSLFLSDGTPLPELQTIVDESGVFSVTIPGTQSYTNLILFASSGSRVLVGIVPFVPQAAQVYDLPQTVTLGDQAPGLSIIDDATTTISLLIEGKARAEMGGLGALSSDVVVDAFWELEGRLTEDPFLTFRRMVTRLLTAANESTSAIPVFTPPDQIEAAGSSLNPEFLGVVEVDYDGDGTADQSTAAYDEALLLATQSFTYNVCYDPDSIRVVFQVDFRESRLDLNCQVIDRFRWVLPDPGDTLFIAGAIHEDQVRCSEGDEETDCATQEEIDLVSNELGDFVPNVTELFDDGTNGDAVAGDGIYSRAFVFPRGVRIAYKYTFGRGGQNWTGTEEWPGNSRLLETIDVNGDEVIVRRDFFGDETSNKNQANMLSPARGGRGTVTWDTDANDDGLLDAREISVDFDADCSADGFPPIGPNPPLTVPCEE